MGVIIASVNVKSAVGHKSGYSDHGFGGGGDHSVCKNNVCNVRHLITKTTTKYETYLPEPTFELFRLG